MSYLFVYILLEIYLMEVIVFGVELCQLNQLLTLIFYEIIILIMPQS